ncbi:MAG: MBOAT family O-acyltransferase [Leptolyngbyaceae cyanobacterium bins.302]|nr:MBOAT family O-acyltransferase [Leptolyngbyaceae cyanobacterium bins.302]
MIFLSYWYLIFVAISLPLYWVVPTPRAKQIVLLAACVAFYVHFAGGWVATIPILFLGVITYLCGLSGKRSLCIGAIVLCVASLVFYKYTLFLASEFLRTFAPTYTEGILQQLNPILPTVAPLAISFFVFEFVHYLVDVLKGNYSITSPLQFALFGLFFPSLVAGPIKRYEDFIPQIQKPIRPTGAIMVYGTVRIAVGLVKKLIADNLTIYLNFWDKQFETVDLQWRWLFLLMIATRIYLDFSGYSDMAIGYAQWLGVKLPENFNFPYIASNLRDFWQRWHISLSTWIRDYIYIPLGGNRHGTARKIMNAIIAFGLCGLWHGAGWNFLAWGLWHGFGLAVSSNYKTVMGFAGAKLHGGLEAVPFIGWAITFLYVSFGWLLFFYPIDRAWTMAKLLLGVSS